MKYILGILGVGCFIVFIICMTLLGIFNGLTSQNQQVQSAWSQVQTQYQRRFDLVPQLVSATKGAMTQEQAVFKAIDDARTHYAGSAPGSSDQVVATSQYDSALSRLLVVMENYPELKSLDSIKNLTDELAGTENRIAVARDRYNQSVQDYNTSLASFPDNIIGPMFGFHPAVFFSADQGSATAPKVDLTL